MENSMYRFMETTINAFDEYIKQKMDEKQSKGFIINREIIEEILVELKEELKQQNGKNQELFNF